MPTRKFDEFDRSKTVQAVEQHVGIKLLKIGSRRKFFEDEDGNPYLVLGCYGNWCGIPEEIITDTRNELPGSKLIIAKRLGTRTKIYWAPLKTLLQSVDKLHVNEEDDRQFNLDKNDPPSINEAPDVKLERLTEIEYPDGSRKKK